MNKGLKKGIRHGIEKGNFSNNSSINKGLYSVNPRNDFYIIKPGNIRNILAFYCPEIEDVNLSSTTINNLVNDLPHGTIESTALLNLFDEKKEVDLGNVTGRVNFGNRYKPTTGVTIMAIMYNTVPTDALQFVGGCGDTGFQGYSLFKSGGNQWTFRANTGVTTINQITATIRNSEILNKWNMFTGTYDGTTSKIYFNDELRTNGGNPLTGNISYTGITANYLGTLFGQTGNAARYWNGKSRAYLIFGRALDEYEITGIYNYFLDLKLVSRIK